MHEILMAFPGVRAVERPDLLWLASGLDEADCRLLADKGGAADGPEAELCRRRGDASILKVQFAGGRPVALTAWKGLTSCHEVFYARHPGGGLLVADHFRNILSRLPAAERAPSVEALADHFLYRTIPAPNTLSRAVRRLGRGERLTLGIASGATESRLFDRAENRAEPRPLREQVDRIDDALARVLESHQRGEGVASLFSGGVDSTLLQTYLRPAVPPVMFALPSYDQRFERGYADRAATLLGTKVRLLPVGEDDYLARLEQAIEATGMPPPHLQLVFYRALFDLEYRAFVMGEQADALFGIGVRLARLASCFASPLGLRLLRGLDPLVPASRKGRWAHLPRMARRLAEPPDSPYGYGGQMGIYTDYAVAEAAFGPDLIRARLQARLDTMLCRVDLSAPPGDRLLRHVETAQMVDYLCEDVMMCFRHLAHARGKRLDSPFLARPLFEAALGIPVADRYVRGLRGKYLLKRLLKRRLPGYDIGQRKGYTHVSFDRYYRRGPLSDVWERYAVPDPIQGEARRRLVEEPSWATWKAITLAIWEARVRRNPDLRPLAGARRFAWEG